MHVMFTCSTCSKVLRAKVEQIGKKNVAEVKQTSSKPEGPLYVVQDGDVVRIADVELIWGYENAFGE